MRRVIASSLVWLAVISAWPQQTSANLQPLIFLAGHWTSQSGDDIEEEYWSQALGDSMIGTFHVVHAGAAVFYEFWAIELEEGKPIFKMKHFHANLLGWEDKADYVRLPVVRTSSNSVLFSRADGSLSLRYERKGDMLISTLHQVKDGKPHEEVFTLHRADSP